MNEYVDVTIFKPLPNNTCSIDKRKLSEASSTGRKIKLNVVGIGTSIIDPKEWWDTAIKREKRIVNYKNNPMIFVYNHIPLPNNFQRNKHLSVGQEALF